MADNSFRSDRNRDPLAELARLIGQGDAHPGGAAQQSYGAERSSTMPAQVDWAPEETYAAEDTHFDERYAPTPSMPGPGYSSYAPQEGEYEHQASAGSRFFSGTAAQFNGFRQEPDAYADEEAPQLPPAHQLSEYATGIEADDHCYDDAQHGDEAHAADEYYDEQPRPRRKSGLVVVMAIFGLAVIGTAGAFGYRAMFGSSVLPSLPPIIKASNGPIRVTPTAADAQTANAGDSKQAAPGTTGSTESLVSREEQPVAIDPPKAAPRVVSTIPIVTGSSSGAPAQNGPAVASATDTVWPPPPPMNPAPPSASVAAPAPPPAPAQASSEPKRVHTVTIRGDQAGGDVAPGSTSPTNAPVARQSHARANAQSSTGSSGPLALVPGSQGSAPAPAQRTRATQSANGSTAVASVNSAPAASSGGGYAVQVTSQRSESEAHNAYRALQAKYPDQLGGRAAIVRRADLGEKGTFYRALVGPFASAEEAAGLCSGLKAAGGSCIVQRN
jgi:hypothetical protein